MTPTPVHHAPRALRWSRRWSIASAAALALLIAPHAALAQRQQPSDGRGGGGGGGGGGNGAENERGGRGQPGGRGLISQMAAFQTDVPPHPFNIILVNPTATSVTLSIVCADDGEGFVEFGPAARPDRKSATRAYKAGEPVLFTLDALPPDAPCAYRWHHRSTKPAAPPASPDARNSPGTPAPARAAFEAGELTPFHTPRRPGSAFTFTIQADSHLDSNMTPQVYAKTLANALADKPDFHVDLGDTFMTDKRREFRDTLPQYVAQRYYFGLLCKAAPLFMVLGNHDGEAGYARTSRDGQEAIAPWSYAQRTRLFPPPTIAADQAGQRPMYTGRTEMRDGQGSHYYAFTWGDAQIIVLDPFWFTAEKMRGPGGRGPNAGAQGQKADDADTAWTDQSWLLTLGRAQYDWLDRTLSQSTARYKFVFTHHLVGGRGRAARGGVESAPYFEWGGRNADGTEGFADRRPGWPMPIHQLLVKHHVSAVFHGHDHLYVRNELDGVFYQCVPQPGNAYSGRNGTRSASEYGYEAGTILNSPGHLRVSVSPEQAKIEFVRSAIDQPPPNQARRNAEPAVNGAVVHQYTIAPSK